MLTIGDIMTREVYTVEETASTEEASWGLARRGIGGAPVRDAEGALVGVVSKTDLVDPLTSEWLDATEPEVQDVMTPQVIALPYDAPAIDAVREMARRNIHRIMVVGASHQLVGIVTPMDVVRALARGCQFEAKAEEAAALPGASPIEGG